MYETDQYQSERINDNEIKQKKEAEEKLRLMKLGKILQLEEMRKIEEWSDLLVDSILFDSLCDNWKQRSVFTIGSVLEEKIIGKEQVLFLIETEEGNKLGIYINTKIHGNKSFIKDPNAFLFQFRKDIPIENTEKIIPQNTNKVLFIFNQTEEMLFKIGFDDMMVGKENTKYKSYYDESLFDQNKTQTLNSSSSIETNQIIQSVNSMKSSKRKTFVPKRILVIQMYETDDRKYQKLSIETARFHQEITKEELKREEERLEKIEKRIPIEQMRQIEQWTNMCCEKIVFNSAHDNWKQKTFFNKSKYFNEILLNHKNIVILITDENKSTFGCYLKEEITTCDKYIEDKNAFIFGLEPNIRFNIIESQNAFYLHNQSEEYLFKVGQSDIIVAKENIKIKSQCIQQSFEYDGITNAICGEQKFIPNQIIVIQMYESEEIKQRKKQQEEHMKELRAKKLKYITQQLKKERRKQIQQLHLWTGKQSGDIIFDSTIDDWNVNTSIFDSQIMNKSNVCIILEDEDGNIFGGYINERIGKYESYINDQNAFVFTLKSVDSKREMTKFEINDRQCAFRLFKNSTDYLFRIGWNDIRIWKQHKRNECTCYQESFNYKSIENALCGKTGWDNPFILKRIIVLQMLETKEMKSKRLSKIIELKSLQLERLNNDGSLQAHSTPKSSFSQPEMKSLTSTNSLKTEDPFNHDSI